MDYTPYLVATLIGYMFGCFNPAWLIVKIFYGKDIRTLGNGNPGASNTALNFGLGLGAGIALLDIAKAIAACLLTTKIYPYIKDLGILSATFAVIGHMFPFTMNFKGGKGFAAYIGLTACVSLPLLGTLLPFAALAALCTQYIIAATLTFIFTLPWCALNNNIDLTTTTAIAVTSIIIFIKHIENLKKIRTGTEPKISDALNKKKEGE